MLYRIALVVVALVLVAGTATWAQLQSTVVISGTIASVDAKAGTITLTDGRVVKLDPGASIQLDGRPATLAELQPGSRVAVHFFSTPAAAQAAPTAPSGAQPSAAASPGFQHPPINATGTIAAVDRQTRIVTLQDGRQLRITEQTVVWQLSTPDQLQPGQRVALQQAQPIGLRESATSMRPVGPQDRMGRITQIDTKNKLIVLDDGTTIRVPNVLDLQPGDEVKVHLRNSPAVSQGSSTGSDVSALPRAAVESPAVADADDIVVLQRESP